MVSVCRGCQSVLPLSRYIDYRSSGVHDGTRLRREMEKVSEALGQREDPRNVILCFFFCVVVLIIRRAFLFPPSDGATWTIVAFPHLLRRYVFIMCGLTFFTNCRSYFSTLARFVA